MTPVSGSESHATRSVSKDLIKIKMLTIHKFKPQRQSTVETSVQWTEQTSTARVELSVPRELVRFSLPDTRNIEIKRDSRDF